MTRGKVNLRRIENPLNRRVTFSKRKAGLLKKAKEISTLCDAEVGLIILSPTGKLFEFASPSMNRIIVKYQKGCSSTGCHIQLPPDYVEILRLELEDLRKQITHSETVCKHIVGEDLHLLNFKQLQQLEKKISLSVRKIRSRKDKILLENVESLKMKVQDHRSTPGTQKINSYYQRPVESVAMCWKEAVCSANGEVWKEEKLLRLENAGLD